MADLDLRPRLVIRVAITGHRPDRLIAGVVGEPRFEPLLTAIDREVVALKSALTLAESGQTVFNDHVPLVRLVTGMADGADTFAVTTLRQLTASGALKAEWVCDAILPAEPEVFAAAMAPSADDAEGDGPALRQSLLATIAAADTCTMLTAGAGQLGFGEQAELILNQSDLVIALWDGNPSRGRGGTAHVISQALSWEMPVIWLDAQDMALPPRVLMGVSLTPQGALKRNEELPSLDLPQLLRELIDVPRTHASHHGETAQSAHGRSHGDGPSSEVAYAAFLAEPKRKRRSLMPRAYDGLVSVALYFAPKPPQSTAPGPALDGDQRDGEWRDFAAACGRDGPALRQLTDTIKPRFMAADDASIAYARRYRSAFVLAFLLSAIAVVLAVGSVAFKDAFGPFGFDEKAGKAVFVVIELTILLAIAGMVLLGHKEHWHERWLDYRALAEALRQLRGRSLLGDDGGIEIKGKGRRAWWLWYLRACVREIGPPGTRLDGAFQRGVLSATRSGELEGQIRYHARNAHRMLNVHHTLHTVGHWGYGIAIVLLSGFLLVFLCYQVGHWVWAKAWVDSLKPWVGFLGVLLPTVGAALAAINNHADFLASGETSSEVERALMELAHLYDQDINPATGDPTYARTKALITQAAELMAADLLAFRAIYGRKPLVLPA